jgi:hypothetical protein
MLSLERYIAVAKSSGFDATCRISFLPRAYFGDVPFRSPGYFSRLPAGTNKNKIVVFGDGLDVSHSNALTRRGKFGKK